MPTPQLPIRKPRAKGGTRSRTSPPRSESSDRQAQRPPDRIEELPDATWRRAFRRRLIAWYRRHRRDLPWRASNDPYRVWVSEIMLQQTQVATVEGYFRRFIDRFPDLHALAEAPESEVLRQWEGLGYYRRARQLHRAAQLIVRDLGGEFPQDPAVIQTLPGIGRYTAGAIASIAFDARAPILEANTIRLYSRLLGYFGETHKASGQQLLWAFAAAVLPAKGCGELNQAMMELGSSLCTSRAPQCLRCPVGQLCPAQANGWQKSIPAEKIKINYQDRTEVAVVIHRRGRVLLRQCLPHERWAGLWDFPRYAVADDAEIEPTLAARIQQLVGVRIREPRRMTVMKHGVTRFRITLACFAADCESAERSRQQKLTWVKPAELEQYPLSVTGRRLARLIAASP